MSMFDRVDVTTWLDSVWATGSNGPFAVIDVETTGLAARKDRVIELAIVRCDSNGSVVDEWSSLFDPDRDPGPTHIHGITADDLVGAPTFASLVDEVLGRLEGHIVVAHNLSFDSGFLDAEFARAGADPSPVAGLCTLELARAVLPDLPRHNLAECAAHLGIDHPDAHRALPDTRVTASVLRELLALAPQRRLF